MIHLLGEFIGKKLLVKDCPARGFRRMEGKIVDETKNTFLVETASGIRRIPKKGAVFEIGGKTVHGDKIMFRAEDRPKKLRKKIR